MDRVRNVLDLLLAEIMKVEAHPAIGMSMHVLGDVGASRFGDLLEPGGDIHAVAINVVAAGDNVTDIDADPETDLSVFGNVRVALFHGVLDVKRKQHRIDDAGKLHQRAVTGQLDDAAVKLVRLGLDEFLLDRFELSKRALFVLRHKPAVADHVGYDDRCKPSLFRLRYQGNALIWRNLIWTRTIPRAGSNG